MIWRKEDLFKLRHGIFNDQIRKRRHEEIPGNPVENVSVGVVTQLFCCLGNCQKGVFSCCFRIGVCLQTDVLPALFNPCA